MGLAGPRRAKGDDVLATGNPVTTRQFEHLHLVELRNGGKVEAVEALGGREPRGLDPALDHPAFPVDQFQFDKPSKVADMIYALCCALPGQLVMLAQEGWQLERLEVAGEQQFGSLAAHAAAPPVNSRMYERADVVSTLALGR